MERHVWNQGVTLDESRLEDQLQLQREPTRRDADAEFDPSSLR
ncbi:MAG: hypothetical protein ABI164_10080 [Acidobacteriaceae bacterium]